MIKTWPLSLCTLLMLAAPVAAAPDDFYLLALPPVIPPGGEVNLVAGVIPHPLDPSGSGYGANLVLPDGSVYLPLAAGRFATYSWEFNNSVTVGLDSVVPAGVHHTTSVTVSVQLTAGVGIAALPGTKTHSRDRATTIGVGDPLSIFLVVASPAGQLLDLYAAVVLPSGSFYCFFQGGQQITLGPPDTLVALTVGSRLDRYHRFLVEVSELPAIPAGTYTLIAAVGPNGGNILTDYYSIHTSSFEVR